MGHALLNIAPSLIPTNLSYLLVHFFYFFIFILAKNIIFHIQFTFILKLINYSFVL